ncbi:hypothetical protein BaRGS_00004409 [Batillaria attramentaria]|uniref:Uncharacterized protein n=1 Tax=Batillaria attramentaria TaxID=370345 RepID=A0ABD0LY51_9CAEN
MREQKTKACKLKSELWGGVLAPLSEREFSSSAKACGRREGGAPVTRNQTYQSNLLQRCQFAARADKATDVISAPSHPLFGPLVPSPSVPREYSCTLITRPRVSEFVARQGDFLFL